MRDRHHAIEQQWFADSFYWDGNAPHPTRALDHPATIIETEVVMDELRRHGGAVHFFDIDVQTPTIFLRPPLGMRLQWCLNANKMSGDIREAYSRHLFSPTYTLFMENIPKPPLTKEDLTAWANDLRLKLNGLTFQKEHRDWQRLPRENARSALEYVRELIKRHPKLIVVRLDLTFAEAFRASREDVGDAYKIIKRAFASQMQHVRSRYGSMVGYIWRLEFDNRTLFRYNLMLLFDCLEEVDDDAALAQLVGEHWKNVVTKGSGAYHNRNAHKSFYARSGLGGLGIVARDDRSSCAGLKRAALYLARANYYLRVNVPSRWAKSARRTFRASDRVFGRGILQESTLPL